MKFTLTKENNMDNLIVMGHAVEYRLNKGLEAYNKGELDGWELWAIVDKLGYEGYGIDKQGKMTLGKLKKEAV